MKNILALIMVGGSCFAGKLTNTTAEVQAALNLANTSVQDTQTAVISNMVVSGSIVLTNTVWDDMTVSALTLNVGAGAPALETYLGRVKQMNYDSGDSSFGQVQFRHGKKAGTDCSPHIHWSTIDDRSAVTNIQFTLVAYYGQIHGMLTNSYSNTVVTAGTNAFIHQLTSFEDFGASVLKESSIVMFEIICDEDGGANDKLFIHDIDFHYQADKLGSNEEIP